MALVRCSECGREVSDKAAACPQCGAPIAAPTIPASTVVAPPAQVVVQVPATKRGGCIKVLGAAVGLLILLAICGKLMGGSDSSTTSTSTASPSAATRPAPKPAAAAPKAQPKPALTVDAIKLWQDYDANEVAADGIYKGRIFKVTGTVSSIDKDFMDNIVLHLRTPNEFEWVMAHVQDSEGRRAASLSKGQRVVVVCKGSTRILGSPTLDDCTFDQ